MTKVSKKSQTKQSCKTGVSGSRFVPMLFSTPMVQAILNKTKTETRRTQGLEKINENPDLFRYDGFEKELGYHYFERINIDKKPLEKYEPIKSKINIDDIIWVRETFFDAENYFIYKADKDNFDDYKWKPSLFMPKDGCRIFLKCVSVHAERLQDIDEQSAIYEGVLRESGEEIFFNYLNNSFCYLSAKMSYISLWQKINGRDSWNKNPFVWVYKFERIERPHDFH
jgi:hypothetical protein